MLAFRTDAGATFMCQADFRDSGYCNIDFADATGEVVPFHLSLRLAEQIAVINRKDPEGWRLERAIPVTLDPARGCAVHIRFARLYVEVTLDGARLGRFGRWPVPDAGAPRRIRRGVGRLRDIACVIPRAGLDPASIRLDCPALVTSGPDGACPAWSMPLPLRPAPGSGQLRACLTDQLSVQLSGVQLSGVHDAKTTPPAGADAGLPYGAPGDLRLYLDGLPEGIAFLPHPHPYMRRTPAGLIPDIRPTALLPGRIWRAAENVTNMAENTVNAGTIPHVSGQIRDTQGRVVAQLSLSRADLARHITTLADSGPLASFGLNPDWVAWIGSSDSLAALQIIEHIHCARLWPVLDPPVRRAVYLVARIFGLTAMLEDPPPDPPAGLPTDPPADPPPGLPAGLPTAPVTPVEEMQRTFARTLRAHPQTDPVALLRDLLVATPLPLTQRRMLFVNLSEWFCLHANPLDLARLARSACIDPQDPGFTRPLPAAAAPENGIRQKDIPENNIRQNKALAQIWPLDGAWSRTAMIPFLYSARQWDTLRDLLWTLAPPQEGWVLTPPIGWLIREVLHNPPAAMTEKHREDLIYAFLGILDKWAPDYWARTACRSMTDAAASLLIHHDSFAQHLQAPITTSVMRAYGLQPGFWQAMSEGQVDGSDALSAAVLRARAAFSELAGLIDTAAPPLQNGPAPDGPAPDGPAPDGPAQDGPAQNGPEPAILPAPEATALEQRVRIARVLALFRQWGCVDVTRFERDLLGPARIALPAGQPPQISGLTDAGCGTLMDEAALRWLAFPHGSDPLDPAPLAPDLPATGPLATGPQPPGLPALTPLATDPQTPEGQTPEGQQPHPAPAIPPDPQPPAHSVPPDVLRLAISALPRYWAGVPVHPYARLMRQTGMRAAGLCQYLTGNVTGDHAGDHAGGLAGDPVAALHALLPALQTLDTGRNSHLGQAVMLGIVTACLRATEARAHKGQHSRHAPDTGRIPDVIPDVILATALTWLEGRGQMMPLPAEAATANPALRTALTTCLHQTAQDPAHQPVAGRLRAVYAAWLPALPAIPARPAPVGPIPVGPMPVGPMPVGPTQVGPTQDGPTQDGPTPDSPPGPTADPQPAALHAQANPLFDTIVTVFSCARYLDDRIPALRAGWLSGLRALGIPYVIILGDGDGTLRGDVLHLDAPDDYEGLPQKTLATIRWVHDHTRFARMLKIDDDCFLNAPAFFHSLSYLTADYYGRPLTRVPGQTDRRWHMAKSRSDRGRWELDKSPEPSGYADGGSGYALSRRAMAAALQMAQSPAGMALRAVSFMEDKLLGDLLARAGIRVQGQDHRVTVLRQSRPGGPLVSQWENGFLPFGGNGPDGADIRVVHLDGHERQAQVAADQHSPLPRPAKVWPSGQALRLGSGSNALDLMCSAQHLGRVNAAAVAVVACMRNERPMLPAFLDHYRGLGVGGFLIADNGSDDGTLDYLLDQPDVAAFSVDTPYKLSHYGVAWQQALMSNFRTNRWSLVADADELLFWRLDRGGSLPDLVAGPDFAGADAARIYMLDMYPKGPLRDAGFSTASPFDQADHVDRVPFLTNSGARGPYSDAPVYTSALRHRLLPGSRAELFVAQKIALLKYRPWMRLSEGLHFVANTRLARRGLIFAHFKYNAAFHAKAQTEVARGQHFNDAEEYRKYLALLSEGRDVIHDPAHSVHWQDCGFVRDLCAGAKPDTPGPDIPGPDTPGPDIPGR